MPNSVAEDPFHVSWQQHLLEGIVHGWPRFWRAAGNLESALLRERIDKIEINRPVFIAGLARAGTTILLEALASHPDTATHQYQDFPGVFAPVCWREILRHAPQRSVQEVERAHGDRLRITPCSPEAMEEPIWMAFDPAAHDPAVSQVRESDWRCEGLSEFYRDHLRKILLLHNRTRYLSKGNYNLARLPYLLHCFPSARIVIPVRDPVTHVASLLKQHRRFREGQTRHPRSLTQMRRVGHFEFGLDRRPLNLGDSDCVGEIQRLWNTGDEVRGWAKYWAMIYRWVANRLQVDERLNGAAICVHYDDLCSRPAEQLQTLFEHVQLQGDDVVHRFASRIAPPDYYDTGFSDRDLDVIQEETDEVVRQIAEHGRCAAPANI